MPTETPPSMEAIAIVGMAGRFPQSKNITEFWRNLRDGVECISTLTNEELLAAGVSPEAMNHPNYVRAKGVLDEVESFDASFFGFNPREAQITDPQQRLFLECAWQAIENAGYNPEACPDLTGVFAGCGTNTYLINVYSNPEILNLVGGFQAVIANDKDFLSTRTSYKLNLRGPSITVQTACSTSLVAVHLACQSLLYYECNMALAGGVSISLPHRAGYFFQEGGILSPDGHCRAFDAAASGTVSGSGVGAVVLKRLSDAIEDRDYIRAVIRGSAINNDGSVKVGFTAPSVHGQAKVIAAAQAVAGVHPESIAYIEAHGTGTALGDPVEIEALTEVFRARTNRRGYCAIGSVKTNIGHLDAAAGVTGLIKTVLALENKLIPPTLNFERPNPRIDFEASPFYVSAASKEWEAHGSPRRAAVNSLGLGGTNAHVILEEAPLASLSSSSRASHLLLLSARTEPALQAASRELADWFKLTPQPSLADVSFTLQVGRKHFSHRRFAVCGDSEEAIRLLGSAEASYAASVETSDAPVFFMFPGGGAQHSNMGAELYVQEPVYRENVDRCLELFSPHLGFDIRQALHGDQAKADLTQTSIGLPALFATEYALAKLWMSWGVRPSAMIGHSLGEYVAACLSEVISLEDAVALVALRSRLFQELPEGAMLSVALPESEVAPLLGDDLWLAAVNAPALCVVSGSVRSIAELRRSLSARDVENSPIHISVAAHSHMVAPILDRFAGLVDRINFSAPKIPYVSNLTGEWAATGDVTDSRYWTRHLRQTVRFSDGVRLLLEKSAILLEVGPGTTLTTLARQHSSGSAKSIIASLGHPRNAEPDSISLLKAMGQLWLAGAGIDWQAFHRGEPRRRVPLPSYPFQRRRYWLDRSPVAQPAGLAKKFDVSSWFYIQSWKRTMPLPSAAGALESEQRNWLIFADEHGLAEAIRQNLLDRNQHVTLVRAGATYRMASAGDFSISPDRGSDYEQLFRSLESSGNTPATILHLWSLSPKQDQSTQESFIDSQRLGYYSLLLLSRAIDSNRISRDIKILVASNELFDVSGAEKARAEKATMLGPCKVIPQEYLNISCRLIDVAVPNTEADRALLADRLLSEAAVQDSDRIIAYRGARRLVESFEPVRLEENRAPLAGLRERGVYLLTGGLGSVGLQLAEYLARAVKARLVLVGRSHFPAKADWDSWLEEHPADSTSRKIVKLREIEELGSDVIIASADAADYGRMLSVFNTIDETFGELNGVIHLAGVTTGPSVLRPISEVGPDESETQFRPKISAVYTLDRLLAGRAVDFCLLFSSNAAVLGGLGMAAYTAANAFMDAYAAGRDNNGTRWISANWDAWPYEPEPDRLLRRRSIDDYAMTAAEASEAFRLITARQGHIVVSTGDLNARLSLWVRGNRTAEAEPAVDLDEPAAATPGTEYAAPQNELQKLIAETWGKLLGVERVGIRDNFFGLGGHSLLATRVVSRLRQEINAPLSLRVIFEHPTVEGLAAAIAQLQAEDAGEIEQIAGDPPQDAADEIAAGIDSLSDDQVSSLLSQLFQNEGADS